jgi:hypothetical protein
MRSAMAETIAHSQRVRPRDHRASRVGWTPRIGTTLFPVSGIMRRPCLMYLDIRVSVCTFLIGRGCANLSVFPDSRKASPCHI